MTQWTPLVGLKAYGLVLARKMSFTALGWIVVFFLSQPFRVEASVLNLFAPLVGSIAGLVIGWYMATNSVEDAGFSGLPLWIILVVASCLPMWLVEGIFWLILHRSLGFGGWMLLTAAMLLALAAAVWHASSQE